MPVIQKTQAKVHDFDGSRWTAYVSPSQGSEELCAWSAEVPVSAKPSPHRVNKEEVLFVLSGRLRLVHEGCDAIAESGDALVVPPDTDVHITNAGTEPAVTWVTT
ncbi:MAG: cupin domain-containing protein, partial [Stackebrandtia sp.]